ncbi:acyl-CoA synthetase [Alteromonas sp. KUL42]|uniref:AMP-binding protein n=1 Tax=Alteromonas sp. KUL42 TaxID=2480797 RepID=UPI001036C66B|nr:AMP-binding protein [Alteromonas sp. KUL42]TAP37198.1 AMP-dependent synthetase [Alteromonas sp. KUL42]GEA06630.1 acyl-CoA synthetase [Alteromonas sp. KUL42]
MGNFNQCGSTVDTISREALDLRARKIAGVLRDKGVVEHDVIAILMFNHFGVFEVVEACRYVGARYVLLNWHSPIAELLPILSDSGAKVLLAHDALLNSDDVDTLCNHSKIHIITEQAPQSVLLRLHKDGSENTENSDTRVEPLSSLVSDVHAIEGSPLRFKGMFPYTSGSTGKPKGIKRDEDLSRPDPFLTYKGLSEALMQLQAGDRFYVSAPLYHSAPHALTLCCLAAGNVDVYIEAKFEPERFLSDVEKHRITHAYIVPTMMVRLLKLPQEVRDKYDVSSLRFSLSTGSALPSDVKEAMIAWFGPIFYESYGASELGFMTLVSSQEALAKPNTVGKPIAGAKLMILREDKSECDTGEVGVIYAQLSMFAPFKYTNTTGTLGDLHVNEYTTVGDMGYLDDDGYLFICDRKKDMIISGGANVFPVEIESVIIHLPEVADCAVFGAPDSEFGEKIIAAVQCVEGKTVSLSDIHQYLEGKLAKFKWPKAIQLCAELPREDTGKIFKNKLREAFID